MKFPILLLFSIISAGAVNAALLPTPDGGGSKVLPGGSTSILPGSTSNPTLLPNPGPIGTKLLPTPANTSGGGDFFIIPTRLKLTRLLASDVGNNTKATREIGEPLHGGYAGNPGGKSLWWRYDSKINGILIVSTVGSDFDTVLGAYVGDSVSGLSTLASDDNSGPNQSSIVTVRVSENSIYYIAVDGYNGASGNIKLSLVGIPSIFVSDGRPPNDDYLDRIRLSGHFVTDFGNNFNATSGSDDDPTDIFFGASSKSVWWTWTAPLKGRVTFSTAGSDFDTLMYLYRRSTDQFYFSDDVSRTDRTSLRSLTGVAAGEDFDIAIDGFVGDEGSIVFSIDQQPDRASPTNDAFDYRLGASGNSYSVTTTNLNLNTFREPGEPVHAGTSLRNSVWWTWTAPGNGVVVVSANARDAIGTTAASLLKPVVAVYTGRSVSSLTRVADAEDTNLDGDTQLVFRTVKGRIYQIAVASGAQNQTGAFTFGIEYFSGAPVISRQPVSSSVAAGKSVVFSVRLSQNSLTPATYRWQRSSGKLWVAVNDGVEYSGTKTDNLRIMNASNALNNSRYRCVVTNRAGTVTSSSATLTVLQP